MMDRLALTLFAMPLLVVLAVFPSPAIHPMTKIPSAAVATPNPWKLTASPSTATLGQSVTFALAGPANSQATCSISFGDFEGPGPSGNGAAQRHAIQANGITTHTYDTYGAFEVRVFGGVCAARMNFVVNPPATRLGKTASTWNLDFVPPAPVAGKPVTLVLFAPPNIHSECPIYFGDEGPSGSGLGRTLGGRILTHGVVTHTYTRFGRFEVRVGAPCAAVRLLLIVSAPS